MQKFTLELFKDLLAWKYETILWIKIFTNYAGTWRSWTSSHKQNLFNY